MRFGMPHGGINTIFLIELAAGVFLFSFLGLDRSPMVIGGIGAIR